MVLQRWEPYSNVRRIDDLFDRLVRGFGVSSPALSASTWSIPIDIQETADEYVLTATLAGLDKDAIKVSVDDRVLSIQAESASTGETTGEDNGFVVRERRHGAYRRSINLPKVVDATAVESAFADGILRVTMPKSKQLAEREIKVK